MKSLNAMQNMQDMDQVCYEKVLGYVREGNQVRNDFRCSVLAAGFYLTFLITEFSMFFFLH